MGLAYAGRSIIWFSLPINHVKVEEVAISVLKILSENLMATVGKKATHGLVVASADPKLQVTDALAGTLQALRSPGVVTAREERELLLAAAEEDSVAIIADHIKFENVAIETLLRLKILYDEDDGVETYDISHVSSSYTKSMASLILTECFLIAK
jgi:hypothetical protein